MNVRHETVTVTTDASGDAVVTTQGAFNGVVVGIRYIKTDFDNGVDFLVETERTGQTLWDQDDVNASAFVQPVRPAQVAAGTDSALTELLFPVVDERIRITVANGGNVKTGAFQIMVA